MRHCGIPCEDAFFGVPMLYSVRPPSARNSRGLASAGCVGKSVSPGLGCASTNEERVAATPAASTTDTDRTDRDLAMGSCPRRTAETTVASQTDQPADRDPSIVC